MVFASLYAAEPAIAASASNPFMDVPDGSWVYEAIVRLASRGIISGYPDGLYKGSQLITRYEAASIIARAAAYFDRSKASARDVEQLLKVLSVEFREELDMIGARIGDIEKDSALLRSRIDGWRLSGRVRMDLEYRNAENIDYISNGEYMGNVGLGDARLNMERWFGNRSSTYFLAQIRANNAGGDDLLSAFNMYYFYTKIPFYFGSFITVGNAGADGLDVRFAYETPFTGRYSTWGWFDDTPLPMIRLDINFVILNFTAYVSHGKAGGSGGTIFNNGAWEKYSPDAWNIFTNLDVKLNQHLGFGLGAQYLIHDDWNIPDSSAQGHGKAWSDIFTSWLGVDYNFLNGAALHGIIYYQRVKNDDVFWGNGNVTNRPDGGIAWRAALDFSQDVLKFTSLYMEYMRVGCGFYALEGIENNMLLGDAEYDKVSFFGNVANYSISMWKIGANQRWNNKFSTWLFYADINGKACGRYSDTDAGLRQYGIGVEYAYSNNVTLGLNYLKWDGKDSLSDKSYSRVRLTTQVSF